MRMRKKGNLDTRIQECGELLLATEGKFTNALEYIKEKDILLKRYFIGKTQMELSNEIGISQAQISRLEKSALDSIKKMIS